MREINWVPEETELNWIPKWTNEHLLVRGSRYLVTYINRATPTIYVAHFVYYGNPLSDSCWENVTSFILDNDFSYNARDVEPSRILGWKKYPTQKNYLECGKDYLTCEYGRNHIRESHFSAEAAPEWDSDMVYAFCEIPVRNCNVGFYSKNFDMYCEPIEDDFVIKDFSRFIIGQKG